MITAWNFFIAFLKSLKQIDWIKKKMLTGIYIIYLLLCLNILRQMMN